MIVDGAVPGKWAKPTGKDAERSRSRGTASRASDVNQ
jgi:hypothetical protein